MSNVSRTKMSKTRKTGRAQSYCLNGIHEMFRLGSEELLPVGPFLPGDALDVDVCSRERGGAEVFSTMETAMIPGTRVAQHSPDTQIRWLWTLHDRDCRL